MKMNSIKIFSVLLILGLMMVACETLTDPEMENQYYLDRVLKDPAFAEGLLANVYQTLPNAYVLDEVATDDAVSNNKLNSFRRMATGEWTSSFSPVSKWTTAYNAIFTLNYFLSVVDKVNWYHPDENITANFAKRFKGEALALRGYYYMVLLINHGGIATDNNLLGVPLVTQVLEKSDNWRLPRNSYQQCVDQINSDFDQAVSLLPNKWENTSDVAYNRVFGVQNKNRINATCVKAFKARLALHAASPAFNNGNYDNDKCAAAATMAGDLLAANAKGILTMPLDYVRFYDADNDANNPDILWRNDHFNSNALESDNAPPSLFGNGRVNPTQNLVDAFPMKNGYPISDNLSGYNPANPYANRDPRLGYYILCNGGSYGTRTIFTDISSTKDGINKTNISTRTGYYLLKLLRTDVNLDPSAKTTKLHFYAPIRWTEIYLIYAEAANEAWGPDADPQSYGITPRDIIRRMRSIAGITPDNYLTSLTSKDQFRELIRNERRIALCFEGFRFWDLRRWGLNLTEKARGVSINANDYSYIDVENRVYPDYAVYGPIPYNEVVKYDGLFQNKGWQ